MPALLGYVVAIVVFLGSGYAGLEWLAAPDVPPGHQAPSDKTASVHPPRAESKPAVPPPNLIAEGRDDSKTDMPAGPADIGRNDDKQPDRTAENPKVTGSDAVPAGGCMPIGLTAGGEMVFPLQCRGLLEAQRGPIVSLSPESKAPEQKEPGQQSADDQSSTAPSMSADATSTERHNDIPSKADVPVSEPTPPTKDLDTHPTIDPSTAANTAASNDPRAPSVDDALPVNPRNGDDAKSAPLVKKQKTETLKPASGRSKLVKMTLLTIEFPDGHREQRLVPYRHRAVPAQYAR